MVFLRRDLSVPELGLFLENIRRETTPPGTEITMLSEYDNAVERNNEPSYPLTLHYITLEVDEPCKEIAIGFLGLKMFPDVDPGKTASWRDERSLLIEIEHIWLFEGYRNKGYASNARKVLIELIKQEIEQELSLVKRHKLKLSLNVVDRSVTAEGERFIRQTRESLKDIYADQCSIT
ncbi:MAG: hypothetical protein ACNA8H_16950 [Anaerolineales bacterium]